MVKYAFISFLYDHILLTLSHVKNIIIKKKSNVYVFLQEDGQSDFYLFVFILYIIHICIFT